MKTVLLVCMLMLLGGCAGNKDVEVNLTQTATSSFTCPDSYTFDQCKDLATSFGRITQTISMSDSTMRTDSTQDGTVAPKTDMTIPVAQQGGVANADGVQHDNAANLDASQTDSNNPVTTTETSSSPVVKPDPVTETEGGEAEEGVSEVGSNKKTFALDWEEDHLRSFAWFLGLTASSFGSGPVIFSDECGGKMTVENPKYKSVGPQGQKYYSGKWESEGVEQLHKHGNGLFPPSYFSAVGCHSSTVTAEW